MVHGETLFRRIRFITVSTMRRKIHQLHCIQSLYDISPIIMTLHRTLPNPQITQKRYFVTTSTHAELALERCKIIKNSIYRMLCDTVHGETLLLSAPCRVALPC